MNMDEWKWKQSAVRGEFQVCTQEKHQLNTEKKNNKSQSQIVLRVVKVKASEGRIFYRPFKRQH